MVHGAINADHVGIKGVFFPPFSEINSLNSIENMFYLIL